MVLAGFARRVATGARCVRRREDEIMSLDWDASRCPEKEFILSEDPEGYRVTMCIIFSLMDVGMSGLADEAAVGQFVTRTAEIAQARGGTMMQQMKDGQAVDRPYTVEEVRLRIGLVVNVSPMTSPQFSAKAMRVLREHAGTAC
jgi:hypothetical protein